MSDLDDQLASIEAALDGGSYRPGAWQRFVDALSAAPALERARLEAGVTRVSDKLHRRRTARVVSLERGLAFEVLGACAGLALLAWGAATGATLALVAAAAVLATALQPLLKVSTGLALGVRYAYAYLRRGEPRFKLQFGSYLAAPAWRRALLHGSGTLGSPLAWLLVSVVAAPSSPTLARVLLWLFAGHLLFQAGISLLAAAGLRRLPLLGLLRLTSAGAAGWELRQALGGARRA